MKSVEGTLVYVCVDKPVPAFVKPGTPKKPDEWKASIVITDKAVKKELEKFGKSLDTLLSLKEVDSADFEETYKCPLPEGAGDEVWVLTLRKSTELGKTGKPVPEQFHPRVYEQVGNTRVDITHTKLVGNGSYGKLALEVFMRSAGGGSVFLKSVLVTDLVEYERKESAGSDGSEFDDDDDTPAEQPAKPASKPAVKPAAKPAAKAKAKVEDDFDDDIPF